MTQTSWYRHESVAIHVTHKLMQILFIMHGFLTYQNQIFYVVISFNHCEIEGTQGPLGYVSVREATLFVHWLILVAPSNLRSPNGRCIMLKPLIKFEDGLHKETIPRCPQFPAIYTENAQSPPKRKLSTAEETPMNVYLHVFPVMSSSAINKNFLLHQRKVRFKDFKLSF